MRIRELQLYGFKSFPHKTTIRLGTGINAIIGPNGCGKTNILDALRWVLGEQSFTTLRCTKNDDVVFGGSGSTPAKGYAEVCLLLENEEGLLGFGAEIEIRRRHYREGESEYYLDRNRVRLKDVQDVFFNSGTGTRAYSIFDLANLRSIIAGDLRPMFEEAATLAKYRERRTETLRKLELTESDLLRVNDIIGERERVVRSLRRQAFRLAAYDRLRNEERRLRLARLRGEYGKARAAEQTAGQEARSKELQAAELGEQIRRVEAELACRQQQYLRSLEERQTLHAEQQQLQNELSRQETAQAVAQGNAQQLAQQQAELAQEATELERTIAQTEKECAELKAIQEARSAKLAQLDVALESSRSRAGASEARLLELRQALVAGQKRVAELFEERLELRQAQLMAEAKAKNQEELRTESVRELEANQSALDELKSQAGVIGASLQAHKSELESVRSVLCARRNEIRNLQARREELTKEALQLGHKLSEVNKEVSALQAALGSKQRDVAREHLGENFRGILGDFLEAQPEHEAMVEVALTGLLEAVVISGADSDRPSEPFSSALSVLGREARWVIVRAGPSQPASASESDDSLLRYVRLRPGTPSSVCTQLQRCRIAATLSEAWSRHQATPEDIFVTPDGIGVFPGDIVVALPSRGGQLAAARRLAELEQTASLLSSRLAAVAAEIEAIDEQLAELARQIEAHEGAVMEQTTDVYRTQAELDSLGRRRADLEQDRRRLRQQETRYTSSVQELTQEAARLAEQAGRLEAQEQEEMKRNQELASAISELEQDIKKALAQGSEILLDLTRARAEVETGESELELRTRERNRLTERATAIAQRRAAIVREIETCQGSVAQCENEISRLRARLAAVEQRLTRLDHTRFPNTAELEKQLAALRPRLEEASGQVMEARLQVLEAEHRRSQLEQEAKQVYNVDLASSDTSEVTGPETTEPELSEKLQTITARLERLGRVNPLAGDEYEKERAELERLKSQRADILQANANLREVIEHLDQVARDDFLTTFSVVRDNFREIFAQLFDGEGDLVLVTPEKPLETGINIVARPKGKSPKRLDQLSDGEKALLALSLLFAFYRVKPAPFCFLDEVDAPLDDANVDRFASFLKELSARTQVVIITHNRATVEQADVLFGVTMEEPGVSKVLSVRLKGQRIAPHPVHS